MALILRPGSMIFMQDSDYFYTIDTQKLFQIVKSYEVWSRMAELSKDEESKRPQGLDRLLTPTTKLVVTPEINHAELIANCHQRVSQLISEHLYPSWSFGSVDTLMGVVSEMVRATARNREKFAKKQKEVSDFNRAAIASSVTFNEGILFGLQTTRDLSAGILLAVAVIPTTMIAGVGVLGSLGAIAAGSAINAVGAYQDNVFDSNGVILPTSRRVGQAMAVGALSFTLAAFGGSSALFGLTGTGIRGAIGKAATNEWIVVTVSAAGNFGTSLYSGKDLLTATTSGLVPLAGDPLLSRLMQTQGVSNLLNRTVVPALYRRNGADPRVTLEASRAILGASATQVRDKMVNQALDAYKAPTDTTDIAPRIVGIGLGSEPDWPSMGVQMQFKTF